MGADEQRPPNNPWVTGIGLVVLLAFGLSLMASVINLWPAIERGTTSGAAEARSPSTVRLFFALLTVSLSPSAALLVLVLFVGALGSIIHTATSFADFTGNRRFYSSWIAWYVVRPVVGASLALLLYFALRGGFFSGNSQTSSVNPYGIAALAGLAGLFSKQATDKLREVFETLFRVSADGGDTQRRDALDKAPVRSPTADAAGGNVAAGGNAAAGGKAAARETTAVNSVAES